MNNLVFIKFQECKIKTKNNIQTKNYITQNKNQNKKKKK